MKINKIALLISILISALCSYALFENNNTDSDILILITSLVYFIMTLGVVMSVKFEYSRVSVNAKVLSGLFFLIGLIINVVFAFIDFKESSYIIINGIIGMVFLLSIYFISKTKM